MATGPAIKVGDEVFPVNKLSNVVGRPDRITEFTPDVDLSDVDTDRGVSRRHAVLTYANGAILVRDTGSTNGTRVNGETITRDTDRELHDGDKVAFGGLLTAFMAQAEWPEGVEAEWPPEPEADLGGETMIMPERAAETIIVPPAPPEEAAAQAEEVSAGQPEEVSAGQPEEVSAGQPEEVSAGQVDDAWPSIPPGYVPPPVPTFLSAPTFDAPESPGAVETPIAGFAAPPPAFAAPAGSTTEEAPPAPAGTSPQIPPGYVPPPVPNFGPAPAPAAADALTPIPGFAPPPPATPEPASAADAADDTPPKKKRWPI
jgi:predicted component of type VI protein secretion system